MRDGSDTLHHLNIVVVAGLEVRTDDEIEMNIADNMTKMTPIIITKVSLNIDMKIDTDDLILN
jgi:hypothetical protein